MNIDKPLLIENLRELSERSLQEDLWVHGDDLRMSSFTEAVCGAFDDAGLSRSMESGAFRSEWGEQAWRTAKALDDAVGHVPEDERPEKIVAHPGMESVRALAGELLRILEGRV